MLKRTLISIFLLYAAAQVFSQPDSSSASPVNRKRLLIVSGGSAIFYAGSYLALNKAWYADYEKTRFHFFDDNPEWNQMDKAGHVWSTYQVSQLSASVWRWTGIRRSHAAIAGAVSGMVYQSIIEIQDAYSVAWGFSWGDVAANVAGASLFLFQDLGWKDQRIQFKLGYHPYKYPAELRSRRNDLYGSSLPERILKDYNSQTYWLTFNIASFIPDRNIPKWLNLAVGYGADGMYGGRINMWTDKEGRVYDYTAIPRSRNFYLSPDIDVTKLRIKSKALKTALFVVNAFRIPLPGLELTAGKLRGVIR